MPCLVLSSLVLASPLAAQTADPVFSGWSWAPEGLGSRPGGMGGAFVAVADGVQAAYVNPAGLALIPLSEIAASSGRPWLGVGTGVPYVRVGAYGAQTAGQSLERGTPTGGSLESSVWEAGLGVAVEPLPRLMLGGSLAWSRLRLDGQRPAAGAEGSATVVSGESGHLRFTGGLLISVLGAQSRALPSLRLGLAYQPGFDWSTEIARGASAEETVDVRRPSVLSMGAALRPTDRWGFSAQADLIRYREVINTLRRNVGDGEGFRLPDALEPRVGAEYGAPLWCGCGVFKVRAGLHYRSPGELFYVGSDPVAAAAFGQGRVWRTVASAGASFFTEHFDHALRLDLDSRDLFGGPDLSFGLAWRF